MRSVPRNCPEAGHSGPMVVSRTLHYFARHFREPIAISDVAGHLGISEDCLDFCFDQTRGMTPAEALLQHRLNRLFHTITEQPKQGLRKAIRSCGLGEGGRTVELFERTFGIEMPLFLLTCRRAAEDRAFRRLHPSADRLVLPS
ncbi:AraC family transcriptional regulator [Cyanobium sp. CH-040]|uniref:AraC family transcriptional regulator n=1 Tax=Cyanobium sp. CH-040 TaxID=2823708 RepID=UPI0020CDA40D|nr:AraC family transcriptional regulator [Cyanobium sp. CH-040]MCP9928407.1 helix-turn-helix transcriptional regulator [Cyanobium sp. CH-040]